MVIWYTKDNGKRINGAAKENYTLQKIIKSNMITREVSEMTKDTGSGSTRFGGEVFNHHKKSDWDARPDLNENSQVRTSLKYILLLTLCNISIRYILFGNEQVQTDE